MTDEPPLVALFTELATMLRPQMIKRCRKVWGDLAEDLVQESLLGAWHGWPPKEIRPPEIYGWFWRILYNKMSDAGRQERQRRHLRPGWITHGQTAPAPQHAYEARDEVEHLVLRVPAPARRLLLATAMGYSYTEMAEQTRAPMGTVMIRLHRARKTLRGAGATP